jgi:hypothetical protein
LIIPQKLLPWLIVQGWAVADFHRKVSQIAKNTMSPDVSSLDYAAFPRVAANQSGFPLVT